MKGTSKTARLRKLAKSGHVGLGILPQLAMRTPGRTPIKYAAAYFRNKIRAPFVSPLAEQFDLLVEQPVEIHLRSRDRHALVAAIENELNVYDLYLSSFLTHPLYGEENQIGFCRGDTLRPEGLREVKPGVYRFRIRGIAVGRDGMLGLLRRPNLDGPPPPVMKAPPKGSGRIFICIPERPWGKGVKDTEWYEFRPSKWKRRHPDNPLKGPIPILLTPRPSEAAFAPAYEELYRDGVVRIAFLFGFDEGSHLTTQDAKSIWEVLTAEPSQDFKIKGTGRFGYHGPGLGFSDPTRGDFRKLNLDGTSVFRRDSINGHGPFVVRYRVQSRPILVGSPRAPEGSIFVNGKAVPAGKKVPAGTLVERAVAAELRLYNFDKPSRGVSSKSLIRQFVSVFEDNDAIHYDGHANYGGGFYIGDQATDILWASDIGEYAKRFSRNHQIFSIGACHSAGYFADLFYNELRPRKTPRNLDIIAAVNETAFYDSVQQGMELVNYLLQNKHWDGSEPPDYETILRAMSRPASFQAYIGAFGEPKPARAPLRKAAGG